MKIVSVFLAFSISALNILAAPSEVRDWKTVFGTTIKAWLQCYTNDTAVLKKGTVEVRYKFSTLSAADQEYLKTKAGIVFSAPEQEIKVVEEIRKKQDAAQQEAEKLNRSYFFKGTVRQIVREGIIFDGKYLSYSAKQDAERKRAQALELQKKSKIADTDQAYELLKKAVEIMESVASYSEGIFLVEGIPDGLVDDDDWSGYVFLSGQYNYVNLLGVRKTIRSFSTTEGNTFRLSLPDSQPEQ